MRTLIASVAALAVTIGIALAGSGTAFAATDTAPRQCAADHAVNILTCVNVLNVTSVFENES